MTQPLKYDIDGDSVAEASTLDFVSAARGENGIWTPARTGKLAGPSPSAPSAPLGSNWNSWVMGIGEFSMSRGLSGVPNYNNNAGGFLAGADYRFGPSLSAGLYAGYQYNYAKYDTGSSTQGNSALFGLYASYANEGGWYADTVIGGGYTGFQTRRSIEFPGINRTANANPNSGQFSAALNLGKDFEVSNFVFGPIIGAQYTYAGIGGFTETGADSLDLAIEQQNANSFRTNLGARLAYNWEVGSGIVLTPELRGYWMHEFLDGPRNIASSLNGGAGPSFAYETETPYSNSLFGGAGVSARFGDRWNGSLFYNVNYGGSNYTNNIISGSLGFSF
jgi:outer membrane lipase/esterase